MNKNYDPFDNCFHYRVYRADIALCEGCKMVWTFKGCKGDYDVEEWLTHGPSEWKLDTFGVDGIKVVDMETGEIIRLEIWKREGVRHA